VADWESGHFSQGRWRHICVDMQRMFAEDTPWHIPWIGGVRDQVVEVARHCADQTIFTRFIPPRRTSDVAGGWRDYYEKWQSMTRDHLPEDLTDILPELRHFVPPARIFDKAGYSPWQNGVLHAQLAGEDVTALVITGGETDVCVLATVLGAIDLGYRTLILEDALCGSADETHDAALTVLRRRFSVQLDIATTDDFLTRCAPTAHRSGR
jgi:nicotinamidase-related amidase